MSEPGLWFSPVLLVDFALLTGVGLFIADNETLSHFCPGRGCAEYCVGCL
jgi:hypothetical protein